MARIRSVKPEFWVSEQVGDCSPTARLTFVGLWNFCDDQGVHPAKPKTLKAELFPMDDITSQQVDAWVSELIEAGLVREFEAPEDGERYWHVTGWERHQRIEKPSFKHPAPPALDSATVRRSRSSSARRPLVAEESPTTRRAPPPGVDRSGEDRSGEEVRSPKARATPTKAKPPGKTLIAPDFAISERVRAWAASKGYGDLDQHLEAFKAKAGAKAYTYADWDLAFMEAIRGDWAKLRATNGAGGGRSVLHSDDVFEASR